MSALSPLYLLGLLAVVGPIVFHMIRRRPRGERPFSSLMFLSPSPPRLTRRGRPEDRILLALRALALGLLACAFARPFFRERSALGHDGPAARRTVLLVDVSASMRRGSLWRQALARARETIDEQGPADDLAIFAFGSAARPMLGFPEVRALDRARRAAVATARLEQLAPTWEATNLGQALFDAIDALQDANGPEAARTPSTAARRIVLVSDLQQGSRLDALREREWPDDVELEAKALHDETPNAGLHAVVGADDDDPSPEAAAPGAARDRRVRVVNGPRSHRESFTFRWIGPDDRPIGPPIAAYVPPGEGRVVRVARPEGNPAPRALVLEGDAAPFDNTLYVAEEIEEEWTIVFIGDDRADDPQGELYYLKRAFSDVPSRHLNVRVASQPSESAFEMGAGRTVPLVVVSGETTLENARRLKDHVRRGGTLLYLARKTGAARALAEWAGGPPAPIEEAAGVGDNAILGEIAFGHPLFAAFAASQYNDFTRVHFWARRELPAVVHGLGGRVLARFERGAPAIWETPIGRGRLIVFASGWRPTDSQLARSSKFVPLMWALVELGAPRRLATENHAIGDAVSLPPPREGAPSWTVRKPSGATVTLAPGNQSFTQTDEPGFYAVDRKTETGARKNKEPGEPKGPRGFVVNLAPSESQTAPISIDTLERLGCRLADRARERSEVELKRQLRGAELENRQKLWRWLIVAVILILIVETGWAGREARRRSGPARVEGLST